MSSPSLSRFVFWVFIIYSVLLRQYLWLNYTYFTKEGEQVRVNDVLMECRDCQSSKYLFLFTNISAKKIDFINKNTELAYGGEPRSAIATGILELRLTDKKFSGLVLREAQIVLVSNLNSFLIKAFIGLKILANKVVDYFGFALGIYFSPDESVLVQGLLTGRLDGVGTDFYNKLKASGLLHLAAASGYNVTMVISLAWGLSFWILPRKFVKYFVVLFIILFTFVSDFSPSVIRAGIMGLAGYWAAEISGSRRSAKRIFLATAGLLLFLFPDWLYDIGFQLSFAATAGMLWVEERIEGAGFAILSRCRKFARSLSPLVGLGASPTLRFGWPRAAASSLRKFANFDNRLDAKPAEPFNGFWKKFFESLAANLAVAPVLAWHFCWKQLGTWGVILNIPASFLVGPLMGLGLLVLIFGTWFPVAAQALAIAGKPLLVMMMGLIEIGARLNIVFANNFQFTIFNLQ